MFATNTTLFSHYRSKPIISLYSTSLHLRARNNLLDEMPKRVSNSHNTTIRNQTANNHHNEAISTFKTMHVSKQSPDSLALAAVIKSSSAFTNSSLGKSLHGFATKMGFAPNAAVQKAVMDMYARFNIMDDSCKVFNAMSLRDSVCWNVLISGYARAQMFDKAMNLFYLMHKCDDQEVEPNAITIAIVLPVCAKSRFLEHGQSLHCYCIKIGLDAETLVGNALVSMYAKCGRVKYDARRSFDLIVYKDVVSWNSIIAGHSENGFFDQAFELFYEMGLNSFLPNYATIANILPICAFVDNGWFYGREMHCYLLRFGLEKDISVCNALLTHYSKVGDMKGAESFFKNMYSRDIVTWNTIISGYTLNGWLSRAMNLFHDLCSSGIRPDSVTLVTILPIFAQLQGIDEGRRIHEYIANNSMLREVTSLGNALISFYGKCKKFNVAFDIFTGMRRKRDLVSWNAMLNAFLENGKWEKLLSLFDQMLEEGMKPDSITITSVLQACASLGTRKVREAHGYSIRAGFIIQQTVANAILNAYAICGCIESAFKVFENLVEKNVVTSNTMISGCLKHGDRENAEKIFNQMLEKDLTTWNVMLQVYTHNDCIDLALNLFLELQEQGIRPDTMSIMSILTACARIASVRLVRQCHTFTIRSHLEDIHLKGSLLDSYSKCGSIRDAFKLFRSSPNKDVIMFTSMIGGFAMHGMAQEAIDIFSETIKSDLKPDHVILTALLSACSHAGLVNEGLKLFKSIKETHGLEPTMEHYACIVDLLSRRGRVKEAYDFIRDMPCEPNANVWGSLLGSCKTHGEVEIGKIAAEQLFNAEGANIGNYVVMSNIYAADGRWDRVEKVRRRMRSKDMKKPAGCSWIEIEETRHVFVAGDLMHPKRLLIFEMLIGLDQQMKMPLAPRHFDF